MYDITDGPGGLEVRHKWTGTNGSVTMNDLGTDPRIKLDDITGLFDSPDTEDDREPRTSRIGESIWPGYPRGKTVVYSGRLQCSNQEELQTFRQQFRQAFIHDNLAEGEDLMELFPHPLLSEHIWSYRARLLPAGLIIDEKLAFGLKHTRTAFQREFQLSLRMSDPRFLLTSGFELLGPFDDNVVTTVNNPGTPGVSAEPTFIIQVPSGGPDVLIENLDVPTPSGHASLLIPNCPFGELTIAFDTRLSQVELSLGGDILPVEIDDYESDWWDEFIPGLPSGDNDLKVTGDPGITWTVGFHPRSM